MELPLGKPKSYATGTAEYRADFESKSYDGI